MNDASNSIYDQIEQRVAAWAAGRPDVLAVIVIGSRSRTFRPADAWSDLDCIVFVEDSALYHRPGDWQPELEAALAIPVWFAAYGVIHTGESEWEYVLQDGLKVDLVFAHNRAGAGADLRAVVAAAPYEGVFRGGARVLIDKTASPPPFQPPENTPQAMPPALTQAAFDNLVAGLLLDLVRAHRLAGRGELWRAARAVNEQWQQTLLELLQWHAQAAGREEAGRWGYGRFLEQWADPRALKMLPETCARQDPQSIYAAVRSALALVDWLGEETAAGYGLRFPRQAFEPTARWLRTAE